MSNYIYEGGVIVADTQTVLTEIENEYKTAFNDQTLIVTPDTPQGVLISAETIARTEVINNNATLANQINPELATGIFLDAIAFLTNLRRTESTQTIVTATLTGQAGTLIPSGSQASSNGNIFELINNVTIPESGTIDADFRSVIFGEIPVLANTLTQIVSTVLGWETVNNTNAGTIGRDTESDAVFRRYRKETLANQGVALPFAIKSNLRLVNGVKSLSFLENTASTTEVIQDITMLPHSIYICIDGGNDEDIAYSLYNSKTLGAAYNGSEEVIINPEDMNEPYIVKFDRPELVPIYIKITVKSTNSAVSPISAIQQAILNYANGLTEEAGFSVGNDVSSFELSATVSVQTRYFVTSVTTSLDNITYNANTKPIGLNQKAQTFANFILVTVE